MGKDAYGAQVRRLLALLSVGVAVGAASPALAACNTFAPATNATVTCSGTSTQGVIADSSTGVTVNVQAGASVVPAANGGLDATHVNWAIDVGGNASITVANGASVDTTARAQQYAIKLNSGSTLIVNGLIAGNGGVTGPVLPPFSTYSGFSNASITVGVGGEVRNTEPTFVSAAIAGGGGGNTYQIDGYVHSTGNGGSGIFVGDGDIINVGATGHIQTDGSATVSDITGDLASSNNVKVIAAQGSVLETHGATGGAIDLDDNAEVTIAGTIHAYGDNPSNPGGQGGSGIVVGANSIVWLKSTGAIITGGKFATGIDVGAGSTVTVDGPITIGSTSGAGLHLADNVTATINAIVTVAGGRGISGSVGDNITISQGAKISSTGSNAVAIFPKTSTGHDAVTLTVAGRIEALTSGKGIYFEGDNASGSSAVSAHANVTITATGSVYAQNGQAYGQLDGCCGYPDIADDLTIAGHVETGVTNGVAIDLNDGADTVTFLPTYSLVGSINGGSDQSSAPTGPEIDTLAFDGAANTSGTFDFGANQVVNFEAGHKIGAGTWTLSGTTTGLSGTFSVDAGRLSVNGTMTSTSFTVNTGGTLAGVGTLGATTILAGGFHAPGNSIGTQTINGNYANHGTLQIEVSPTLADKLIVNGAVDITGATLALTESPLAGWDPTHDYTIIDNDGVDAVTGTFASITDNFAFLDPTVIYNGGTGNDVVLTVLRNSVAFATTALTPNETAAATGAQSLGAGNPVYDAILPLSTTAAPGAFDQLSGEIYATLAGTEMTDSRTPREAALDRVDAAFAALEAERQKHGRNIWSRMVGDIGVINADGNAAQTLTSTGGFIFGADEWLSKTLLLGGEAGVTFASVAVPDRNSTANVDSVHLGIYGGADFNPLQLSFGATLSGHGAHVTRTPTFAGFTETLDSDSAGLTAQLFGEIGYAFKGDAGTIEPFAGLALVHEDHGAYTETGGSAALSGKAASIDAALLTLGVKASSDFVLPGDVKARAKAVFGWQGTLASTPTATHSFAGGTPFTVSGAALDSHLLLDSDVEFDLPGTAKLDVGYHGSLGTGGGHSALLATLSGTF